MGDVVVIRLVSKMVSDLYTGRAGRPGIAGIIGVPAMVSKYALMQKAATAGCPFAASAFPEVNEKIATLNREILKEIENTRSIPVLIPVECEVVYKHFHDVTDYHMRGIKILLHALLKLDELVHEAYKARLGGAISKKAAYRLPHPYKKRLRAVMFYCYQYQDYNFRGSTTDKHRKEWSEMVRRFGEPQITVLESVV